MVLMMLFLIDCVVMMMVLFGIFIVNCFYMKLWLCMMDGSLNVFCKIVCFGRYLSGLFVLGCFGGIDLIVFIVD